jgi:hypothetical protein
MTTASREFTAQRFEFRTEVVAPVVLNQHKGSALRGALFGSLRKVGCARQELKSCRPCPLVEVCPVSFLLATVDETARRGGDVPRPFTVQPPLGRQNIFQPGDQFNFGLTLFAGGVEFLPYLLVALQEMERDGIGVKTEHAPGRWRRGAFRLHEITATNPLSGTKQTLFKVGGRSVSAPDAPVTHSQVQALTDAGRDEIRTFKFTFHTPTRLIREGRPLARPEFGVLVQRLIERLSSLSGEYAPAEFNFDFAALMDEAATVKLVESRVRWEEVRGYSHRQEQDLSLSGFVGEATFSGRVPNLLPLLVWGQLTHVGKDATKGNGWYSLEIL